MPQSPESVSAQSRIIYIHIYAYVDMFLCIIYMPYLFQDVFSDTQAVGFMLMCELEIHRESTWEEKMNAKWEKLRSCWRP